MSSETAVAWWQRLLFGFGASLFTLLLLLAFVAARDFWRDPTLQWGNSGEVQVVGYLFIFGGLAVLFTFIVFVVPLVLIWPAESQQKHWYAMLSATTLWPPILMALTERQRPSMFFHEIRYNLGIYSWLELFTLCACGCYLLLLRWQYNRRIRNSIQQRLETVPQDAL